MNEPWWFDYLRGETATSFLTASGYLLTALLLFWPGWKLTGKIDRDWIRIFLRAGLVAIAFAPAILMDPGGTRHIMPASISAIVEAIMYTVSNLALDFYVHHALISILLIWFIGLVVGRVFMRLQ